MPVPLMLATLTDRRDFGDDWLLERKLDGERCVARKDGADVRLESRTGKDLTGTYPEVRTALAAQAARRLLLDGEVVAYDGLPIEYHDPAHPSRVVDHLLIPPAGRVEAIVAAPERRDRSVFRTRCVDTGPDGDPNPAMVLADIALTESAPPPTASGTIPSPRSLATGLALVPLVVLGTRPGHEIEHPLAVVILGGLFTSTLLSLFVLPSLYLRFGHRKRGDAVPVPPVPGVPAPRTSETGGNP